MKKAFFFMCIFILFITLNCYTQEKSDKVLKGAYIGQEPPGSVPEIFAPGFISTDKNELNSVFTPDGKEFYFSIRIQGHGYKMFFTREENDGWTKLRPVPFAGNKSDVDMCITYDGKRMYFGSTRPVNGETPSDFKIWYVDRKGESWSEAKYLNSPVNAGSRALYPTVAKNGTMYFQAIRNNSYGGRDIYYSRLVDGKYTEPVHLGKEINSIHGEGDVLIAPDESFMIVYRDDKANGFGKGDLYISFRRENGSWTKLKNMGKKINSSETEYCPMLSPDGKYFFFTSRRTGNGDIYWIDAGIIDELKPKDLR